MLSNVLNTVYPGENWKAYPKEARFVNEAGVTLTAEEVAGCANGMQLKMLLDAKREARQMTMLDNALSWAGLPDGQGCGTMDAVPPAHAAPQEQHG